MKPPFYDTMYFPALKLNEENWGALESPEDENWIKMSVSNNFLN